MITLSKEGATQKDVGFEPSDLSAHPILLVGPKLDLGQNSGAAEICDACTSPSENFAPEVARQQAEMAMLHRALVKCGLVGVVQNEFNQYSEQ